MAVDHSAMSALKILNAGNTDPSRLAAIRVAAMQPSLEAVGRFDPERARNRFLETYNRDETWLATVDGAIVGFYVLRHRNDHDYLDHIYIDPAHQGEGLGRKIMLGVQQQARERGLPIRLMALRSSPANDFYQSFGFVLERSDALDNYYTWDPAAPVAPGADRGGPLTKRGKR